MVNNAGIGMMGAMGDTTEEELLTVYRTNVVGLHTVSRASTPHLIASQGHLMHVGSVAGVVGLPFRGVYCSSKAAVELIAEAQSMELARHRVRVTVLAARRLQNGHQQQPSAQWPIPTALSTYPGFEDGLFAAVNSPRSPTPRTRMTWARPSFGLLGAAPAAPLYVTVAPPLQRLAISLKRSLPARTFERLIARRYPL